MAEVARSGRRGLRPAADARACRAASAPRLGPTRSRCTTRSSPRLVLRVARASAAPRCSPGRSTIPIGSSELARLGVDAIVTDDPQMALRVLATLIRRESGFESCARSRAHVRRLWERGSSRPRALANARAHAVPSGVRIAGVRVGGLAPAAAAAAVRAAFAKPLTLSIDGTKVELHPAKLATAYIKPAVGHALSAPSGTNVHLVVSVHGAVRARSCGRRSRAASTTRRATPRSRSSPASRGSSREVDGARLEHSADPAAGHARAERERPAAALGRTRSEWCLRSRRRASAR